MLVNPACRCMNVKPMHLFARAFPCHSAISLSLPTNYNDFPTSYVVTGRMINASSHRVGIAAFRSPRFITSGPIPSPTTSCPLPHLIRLSQPSVVHDERRQSQIQVLYEQIQRSDA